MTIISVNDLSLFFGTKELFSGISFALNENDRMGIVGVNGCGKSTLLSMILGETEPDSGSLYISKQKSRGINNIVNDRDHI